jgi:hypothetical protein
MASVSLGFLPRCEASSQSSSSAVLRATPLRISAASRRYSWMRFFAEKKNRANLCSEVYSATIVRPRG